MTVKELIKRLQNLEQPNAIVNVYSSGKFGGDVLELVSIGDWLSRNSETGELVDVVMLEG